MSETILHHVSIPFRTKFDYFLPEIHMKDAVSPRSAELDQNYPIIQSDFTKFGFE